MSCSIVQVLHLHLGWQFCWGIGSSSAGTRGVVEGRQVCKKWQWVLSSWVLQGWD